MEDKLSLASIYYLRNQFHEAIEVYKSLLAKNKYVLPMPAFVLSCFAFRLRLLCVRSNLESAMQATEANGSDVLAS